MYKSIKTQSHLKPQSASGFTLIELSIVILIIGVVLAAVATPYRLYVMEQQRLTTEENMEKIANAISNHLKQNGRYPCPASLTSARGDADYGMETECDPTVTTGPTPYPAWTTDGECLNGLCFERSIRQVNLAIPPAAPNMVFPVIRRGAIPFRALQLAEDEVLDGYGNRIQYAVTEHLAVPQGFLTNTGGVEIRDNADDTVLFEAGSAEFLVFSSGKDARGAYSLDGQLVQACQNGLSDSENCNTSTVGSDANAIYRLEQHAETNTGTHFDDRVMFSATQETPLWRIADDAGLHIRDMIDAETSGRSIGVRTNNPAVTFHVDDDAKVDSGFKVFTNRACDENGNDCVDVRKFGGDDPTGDFTCGDSGDAGPYVTSIGDNKVECSAAAEIRCPEGQVVSGFINGELKCKALVGCESKNVDLCYNPSTGSDDVFNLPASYAGANVTTDISGHSYREFWECESDGDWDYDGSAGACNCNAGTNTNNVSCNAAKGYGNWTGTLTTTQTTVCPTDGSDPVVTYNTTGTCTCVNDTDTQTIGCPWGYTGHKKRQRDWTCNSTGTNGSYGSWTTIEDTCTCNPSLKDTDYEGCPSGFSGHKKRERYFDCSSNGWGSWTTIEDTCSCTGGTETRTIGCTAPQKGNITQQRTYNCSSNSWGPWQDVSNNCGSVSLRWRAKSPQTGPHSGSLSKTRDGVCGAGQAGKKSPCSYPATSGHWHYDTCECE